MYTPIMNRQIQILRGTDIRNTLPAAIDNQSVLTDATDDSIYVAKIFNEGRTSSINIATGGSVNYTLPSTLGSTGSFLSVSDSSGNLSWSVPSGSGGATSLQVLSDTDATTIGTSTIGSILQKDGTNWKSVTTLNYQYLKVDGDIIEPINHNVTDIGTNLKKFKSIYANQFISGSNITATSSLDAPKLKIVDGTNSLSFTTGTQNGNIIYEFPAPGTPGQALTISSISGDNVFLNWSSTSSSSSSSSLGTLASLTETDESSINNSAHGNILQRDGTNWKASNNIDFTYLDISGSVVLPRTTNTTDIGSSSKIFKDIYCNNLTGETSIKLKTSSGSLSFTSVNQSGDKFYNFPTPGSATQILTISSIVGNVINLGWASASSGGAVTLAGLTETDATTIGTATSGYLLQRDGTNWKAVNEIACANIKLDGTALTPKTTNNTDLGSSTLLYKDIYSTNFIAGTALKIISGSNTLSFTTATQTADKIYKFPAPGTANQVLTISSILGNEITLGWASASSGGVATLAGLSETDATTIGNSTAGYLLQRDGTNWKAVNELACDNITLTGNSLKPKSSNTTDLGTSTKLYKDIYTTNLYTGTSLKFITGSYSLSFTSATQTANKTYNFPIPGSNTQVLTISSIVGDVINLGWVNANSVGVSTLADLAETDATTVGNATSGYILQRDGTNWKAVNQIACGNLSLTGSVLKPNVNNITDLGSTLKQFKNIYSTNIIGSTALKVGAGSYNLSFTSVNQTADKTLIFPVPGTATQVLTISSIVGNVINLGWADPLTGGANTLAGLSETDATTIGAATTGYLLQRDATNWKAVNEIACANIKLDGTALTPKTTNTTDLGSSTLLYKDIYSTNFVAGTALKLGAGSYNLSLTSVNQAANKEYKFPAPGTQDQLLKIESIVGDVVTLGWTASSASGAATLASLTETDATTIGTATAGYLLQRDGTNWKAVNEIACANLKLDGTALTPKTTNTTDLGSSTLLYKDIYSTNLVAGTALKLGAGSYNLSLTSVNQATDKEYKFPTPGTQDQLLKIESIVGDVVTLGWVSGVAGGVVTLSSISDTDATTIGAATAGYLLQRDGTNWKAVNEIACANIKLDGTALTPKTTNNTDLGSSTLLYKDIYSTNLVAGTALKLGAGSYNLSLTSVNQAANKEYKFPTPGTANQVLEISSIVGDVVTLGWSSLNVNPQKTITVTNNGNTSFSFTSSFTNSSTTAPTITLVRGETYVFNVADYSTHPFAIKYDNNGSLQNPNGVSNNDTAVVTFTPRLDEETPLSLIYMCSNYDPAMRGVIKLVTNYSLPASTSTVRGGVIIPTDSLLTLSGTNSDELKFTMNASIVPTADVTYDIGSSSNKVRNLYLGHSSLYLGQTHLKAFNNTANYTFTLPETIGTTGQCLITDGSGNSTWTSNITTLQALTDTDDTTIGVATAGYILQRDGTNWKAVNEIACANLQLDGTALVPKTTNNTDLGSSTKLYKDIYSTNFVAGTSLKIMSGSNSLSFKTATQGANKVYKFPVPGSVNQILKIDSIVGDEVTLGWSSLTPEYVHIKLASDQSDIPIANRVQFSELRENQSTSGTLVTTNIAVLGASSGSPGSITLKANSTYELTAQLDIEQNANKVGYYWFDTTNNSVISNTVTIYRQLHSGQIYVNDVGGTTGTLTVNGVIATATGSINVIDNYASVITCTYAETFDYAPYVQLTIMSGRTNAFDADINQPVITSRTTTGFTFYIEETTAAAQNIWVSVLLINSANNDVNWRQDNNTATSLITPTGDIVVELRTVNTSGYGPIKKVLADSSYAKVVKLTEANPLSSGATTLADLLETDSTTINAATAGYLLQRDGTNWKAVNEIACANLQLDGAALVPKTTNNTDLGSSTKLYKDIYSTNLVAGTALKIMSGSNTLSFTTATQATSKEYKFPAPGTSNQVLEITSIVGDVLTLGWKTMDLASLTDSDSTTINAATAGYILQRDGTNWKAVNEIACDNLQLTGSVLKPKIINTTDLGTSTKYFKDTYSTNFIAATSLKLSDGTNSLSFKSVTQSGNKVYKFPVPGTENQLLKIDSIVGDEITLGWVAAAAGGVPTLAGLTETDETTVNAATTGYILQRDATNWKAVNEIACDNLQLDGTTLVPKTTNNTDLGSSTKLYKDIYSTNFVAGTSLKIMSGSNSLSFKTATQGSNKVYKFPVPGTANQLLKIDSIVGDEVTLGWVTLAPEYMVTKLSATQNTVTAGSRLQFNSLLDNQSSNNTTSTENIVLDTTTNIGQFTLKANNTYKLEGQLGISQSAELVGYYWYDITNSKLISNLVTIRRNIHWGEIAIGDIGGTTGSLSVAGFVASATANNSAVGLASSRVDVVYSEAYDTVPFVVFSFNTNRVDSSDNDIFQPIVTSRSTTGFSFYIEETSSVAQNLWLYFAIINSDTSWYISNRTSVGVVSPSTDIVVEMRLHNAPGWGGLSSVYSSESYAIVTKLTEGIQASSSSGVSTLAALTETDSTTINAATTGYLLQRDGTNWKAVNEIACANLQLDGAALVPKTTNNTDLGSSTKLYKDIYSTNFIAGTAFKISDGTNSLSFTSETQSGNKEYKFPVPGTANKVLTIASVIGDVTTLAWLDPPSGTSSGTSSNVGITVSNNSSTAYNFSGTHSSGSINNPTLTVVRGNTYTFDCSNVYSAHPFLIKLTADASGSDVNGVSGNGTASVVWNVRMDEQTPTKVYYICQNHSVMQGEINIITKETLAEVTNNNLLVNGTAIEPSTTNSVDIGSSTKKIKDIYSTNLLTDTKLKIGETNILSSASSEITYTLPADVGTTGQVLTTAGSGGVLSWTSSSGIQVSQFAYGRMYNVGTDSITALTSSFVLYNYYSGEETAVNMTIDRSTGKFTITTAGTYECVFYFTDDGTSVDRCAQIYKNGSAYGRGIWGQQSSSGNQLDVTFPVMDLIVGDYIQVYWKGSSADTITLQSRDAEVASFTCKLVSGTVGISTVQNSYLSGQLLVSDGTTSNWKRLERPTSSSAQVLKYNGGNVYWDPAAASSTSFSCGRLYNNDDDYSSHTASTTLTVFTDWSNSDSIINMTVDNSTGKFTIQAAGYYKCNFFMANQNNSADAFAGILLNGVLSGLSITNQSTGYNISMTFPPIYCSVGDTLQLALARSSSTNFSIQAQSMSFTHIVTTFEAYLISGVSSTQTVVTTNTSSTLQSTTTASAGNITTGIDISNFWTSVNTRKMIIIMLTAYHNHRFVVDKNQINAFKGRSFEFVKYSNNYITCLFSADGNSITFSSASGRPLTSVEIWYESSTTAATGSAVPSNVNTYPKRWSFGKTRGRWVNGTVPSSVGVSLTGNAVYDTTSTDHKVIVVNSTAQTGRIVVNLANYTDWEIRAHLKVAVGGTDGDGIFFFGNSDSDSISYNTSSSQIVTATTGYMYYAHRYSGDSNPRHRLNSSNTVLKSENTMISASWYDSNYAEHIFRRVNGVITYRVNILGSGNVYPTMEFSANENGSNTNIPNGTYFGLGAITGGAWQTVNCSYFEVRSLGDAATEVINDTD